MSKKVVVEDEVRLSMKDLRKLVEGASIDIEMGTNLMGEKLVIRLYPPTRTR